MQILSREAWGRARDPAFVTESPAVPKLPAWRPHSEWHTSSSLLQLLHRAGHWQAVNAFSLGSSQVRGGGRDVPTSG